VRVTAYILALVFSLCFIGGLFWGCLESVAFERGYYSSEYARLDRETATGMSAEELDKATQALFDYIRGERQDLNVTAQIGGAEQSVFNEKEKEHMADVQRLYRLGSAVRYILWAVASVCLIMLALVSRRHTARVMSRGYLIALAGAGAAAGLAASAVAMDFDRFWNGFHRLFFTNDLWLLDPSKDMLIRMFPPDFFAGMADTILLRFGALLLVFGAAAVAVLIATRNRKEAF